MITNEEWYRVQTEKLLRGEDKRTIEQKEERAYWNQLKEQNMKDKQEWISRIRENIPEEEEESEEAVDVGKLREYQYSETNPYWSEWTERRITRELREILLGEKGRKEGKKLRTFWLFHLLFGNRNQDIVKYYKTKEQKRLERVKRFKEREAKKTKDRTKKREYDYTKSAQAQREDRNVRVGHGTSKREKAQIDIKKLQFKALKRVQKLLRRLKEQGRSKTFLRSLAVYAAEVIPDSDPAEVMPIITQLEKDVMKEGRKVPTEDEVDIQRYVQYSEQLRRAREFGISYQCIVEREKRKTQERLT